MYRNYILKPFTEATFEGIGFEGSPSKIKKYEYFPSLLLEELKHKNLYLLLKPSQFFYEIYQLTLPIYNPQILRIKLKERIDSLGYFTKPYYIFWKILEKRDTFYRLAYIAIEMEEIEKYRTRLKEIASARVFTLTFLP
ncbi:MAG: hypothetical protein DSZ24_05430, partial [Thermodesulfatator sp.]